MSNSIIIGFSRPSKLWPPPLFAWLIMLFDWSNFSHAYIRFHLSEYNRDVVFQASGTRVNFISWDIFKGMEVIVREFEIPLTPETMKSVVQYALTEVGTPYALFEAIIGIPLVKLASLFGRKIKNPINQKGDFCSELAAIILTDYSEVPFTADEARSMTPTDVYNYLVAHNPN